MKLGRKSVGEIGRRISSILVPSPYREDSTTVLKILLWVLIGLLIRFLFMPVSTHSDMLGIYGRSHLIAYHGWPTLPGMFAMGAHYLHALFLLIIKPFLTPLPGFDGLFYWHDKMYGCDLVDWARFITHPEIYRILFLLKAPYLVFDFACAFLLLHILSDRKKGLLAFIFWMVNPVSIYVVYIFGRYETLHLFFIILSLYFIKKNRFSLALLILGVAVTIRIYPIMLLLPFAIILGRNFGKKVWLGFLGFVPWIISQIPNMITKSRLEFGIAAESSFSGIFFGLKWDLLHFDALYVFVVGYALIVLYSYYVLHYSFENLRRIGLAVLLVFFALCYFHPQWFTWIAPFVVLELVENRRLISLYAIQVVAVGVYTFNWGVYFAGWLFLPINPEFFRNIQGMTYYVSKIYSPEHVILTLRSIFTAVALFMVYLVFSRLSRQKKISAR